MTDPEITDKQLSDLLTHVLDDLELIQSVASGLVVTLDDVRNVIEKRSVR